MNIFTNPTQLCTFCSFIGNSSYSIQLVTYHISCFSVIRISKLKYIEYTVHFEKVLKIYFTSRISKILVLNSFRASGFSELLLARLMGQYCFARWCPLPSDGVCNTPRLACRPLHARKPSVDVIPPPV